MTIYEMRTYTLQVGKMTEAVRLYTQFGYPAQQNAALAKWDHRLCRRRRPCLTDIWKPYPCDQSQAPGGPDPD